MGLILLYRHCYPKLKGFVAICLLAEFKIKKGKYIAWTSYFNKWLVIYSHFAQTIDQNKLNTCYTSLLLQTFSCCHERLPKNYIIKIIWINDELSPMFLPLILYYHSFHSIVGFILTIMYLLDSLLSLTQYSCMLAS